MDGENCDKLIKGYVNTVFNIWRMGKDARTNYDLNRKRLEDISEILDDHITLLEEAEKIFSDVDKKYGIKISFVESFDMDDYRKMVMKRKKTLERTLVPLKNISKKYERILKILEKNGFQILEFNGKKFDDGMSIKVLGYDSREDVEEDTIIETIKPAIFFNDREYMKAEVIVSKADDK